MCQSIKLHLVVIILVAIFRPIIVGALPAAQVSALDLVLLHTNDLHGHFVESAADSNDCSPEQSAQNKCYGGFPRISTLVKQYRGAQQSGNGPSVLYLNAGDTYVGTPWFYLFKDEIAADFMNAVKPDAGTLGNHEFDYGQEGLVPFLNNVSFPVVIANLKISDNHLLWKTRALQKSVVFNVKGFKIGVIGYLTPDTKTMARTGDVEFLEETKAINAEAEKLKDNGVQIIIALGHSGYPKDQEIAKECPLVDVVVGGHSHSLLYTGEAPVPDVVEGPYPTMIIQKSGKKVPVVQASAFSKYLGKLELSFDKAGNLLQSTGNPILLDYRVPKDPELLNLLEKYRPAVDSFTKAVVGNSKVQFDQNCNGVECNLGNLITDAWIYSRSRQYNGTGWTDAPAALMNSGGIRAGIQIGAVSKFILSTILPFDNKLMVVFVPGSVIKSALERAVENHGVPLLMRSYLQMSGIKVVYDVGKEVGQRVQSAEILCSKCAVPVYEKLDLNKEYGVIIDTFVYNEGDGFTMFKPYKAHKMNMSSLDSTLDHIKRLKLIYTAVEGRSKVIGNEIKQTA